MSNCILLLALSFLLINCTQSVNENYKEAEKIAVAWELISNFTEEDNIFEAGFDLRNNSNLVLNDNNWALFFNMSPRSILSHEIPQAATVEHINGDWYRLIPNKGFHLDTGDMIEIRYKGTEGVIKETDAPLGLYFVFYDDAGGEKEIVQVADFTIKPFERAEQLLRGKKDQEPLPAAAQRYQQNLSLSRVGPQQLLKIIPSPVSIKTGGGKFKLDNNLTIFYDQNLESEARFLSEKLNFLTGTAFQVKPLETADKGIFLRAGKVQVKNKGKEAYRLHINGKGISITGSDQAGVFYGLQSLLALVSPEDYLKKSNNLMLDYIQIEDAPRFHFRGLHMDVSRNFQTKETVMKILDLLAFYKINHFLFYTTEDEGWRLEIEGLPELTEVGAQREHTWGKEAPVLHPSYGSGPVAYDAGKYGSGYYTKEDFIEILKYARERHIKVIPELNFPGHARAAIKAMEARYNRLMEEGKEKEANEYRLIDPEDKSIYLSAQAYKDNVVSVARESTYRFYEKVVDEISKMYQEAGLTMDVIHAGGDEVPEGSWTASPMAAKLMEQLPDIKDPINLQAHFFRELLKRLETRNLEVHGWEEVALTKTEEGKYIPNPEFVNRKVVPYIWNNMFDYPDLGYQLANMGYSVVLCNVSNFYFDLAYSNDPKEPGLYWAGFVNTRNAWAFMPYDWFKTTYKTSMGQHLNFAKENENWEKLKPEARKNILGLEAQLWSETIKGRDMIEYYMLPKLLGFAESAWAPERNWENIQDFNSREENIAAQWNVFANTLGQKEFLRLNAINGGYNYRLPQPGAIMEDGMLKANVEFPGLEIRYTTDGSEPDINSSLYEKPVEVSGIIKLKNFDASGRSGMSSVISTDVPL